MSGMVDQRAVDLLPRAARGEVEAIRSFREYSFARFNEGEVTYAHAVLVAEVWARLAAEHGAEGDRLALASVLRQLGQLTICAGDPEGALTPIAEAALILNTLADEGSEDAAVNLNLLEQQFGEETMRRVTEIKRHLDSEGAD